MPLRGHVRYAPRAPWALALSLLAAVALAPASPATAGAATREPLGRALAEGPPFGARVRPSVPRLTIRAARGRVSTAAEPSISSSRYGPAELARVRSVLRSLAHGPELAQLHVEVLAAAELRSACGATVVACYSPRNRTMYVWGEDRPVAGVPRAFAIAHEYGHHIVASRRGEPGAPLAGTARWATYERVCQLTRRGRVFPHGGADRYWDDPEEAFAQAYAQLNRPAARLGWQYSRPLRPSAASLSKIHADVTRPRRGPVVRSWDGAVAAPPAPAAAAIRGRLAVGAGRPADDPRPVARRALRTPLDGTVSVSLAATGDAGVTARLLDPVRGRVLARASAPAGGSVALSFANCGRARLRLEVRSDTAPATFRAEVSTP